MFGIFKKKDFLADCIPDKYTDIHTHTLPGLDDGSKSFEQTRDLLQSMIDLGFGQVFATPHTIADLYPNTKETIQRKYAKTVEEVAEQTLHLKYQFSSEYMIDDKFEALVKNDDLIPIREKYILVEMSYINPPIFLADVLFLMVSKGYTPILAHPERYNFYRGEKSAYEQLKRMGCKFQLNLLSTVGYYGSSVAKTANMLLKEGMYDFSGSDVHHENHIKAFYERLVIKETGLLKDLLKKNDLFFR